MQPTEAPSLANAREIASPMPRPAPVTIATLSWKRAGISLSLPRESGFAFRDESRDPLSGIGGLEQRLHPLRLQVERLFERKIRALVKQRFRRPDRERREPPDLLRQLEARTQQALGLDHAIHESERERLGGIDQSACHEQLLRANTADRARQSLRPAPAGKESERPLGQSEPSPRP